MERLSWMWMLLPFLVGVLLMTTTPNRWIGADLGVLGSSITLVSVWIALWLASRQREESPSSVSLAEKENWVALFYTGALALFIASELDVIAQASSVYQLAGMGKVIVATLIGWIVLSSVIRQRSSQRVKHDERDGELQRRADTVSHTAICVTVIGLAVTLGFSPANRLAWFTPLLIAHLLMLALIVASFTGHASAAWAYWNDRR